MNSKGFTLIELISIIMILVAIFFISFPSLMNISKSEESKKFNSMVKDLCIAGESYIYANNEDFEESLIVGNTITIEVDELIEYGSVSSTLQNPKTNTSISGDLLQYTVLSDNSLDCNYIDN